MEQAEEGHRKRWSSPQVDHYFEDDLNVDNQSDNQEQRYPRRDRRLPERYGVYFCHACGQASSKEGQVQHACHRVFIYDVIVSTEQLET